MSLNGEKKKLPPGWRKSRLPYIHPLLRRLLIAMFVVVVSAAVVYWKRAAIRQYGNEWNADRHLAKAEQAFEQGAYSVALRRAITSLELEPDRIDSVRILARSAREVGDSRLLLIGHTLFRNEEATLADKALALGAINDVGYAAAFRPLWEQLSEEQRQAPEVHFEYVRYLLGAGNNESVIDLLGEIEVSREPGSALLLIEALLGSGKDERAMRLSNELLTLDFDPDDKERLITRLADLEPDRFPASLAATMQQHLAALPPSMEIEPTLDYTLRLARDPAMRASLVREATRALLQDELDPLCRWLMRLGESEAILNSISEVQAYRSNFAYEARVRALIDLERLEEAFTLLQYPPDIADRTGVLLAKARVAGALGRKSEETSAWQGALVEAERDQTRNQFLDIARFARSAGELRVAADALVAACRHPRGLLPPSGEIEWLLPYLIENDRPDDLLTVSNRFLRAEGGNPVLLNNAIYLTMILGGGDVPVENLVSIMEELAEKHRGVLGIRTTLALAHLMADQPVKAYEVFKPEEFTGIGWQRFAASDRAVFAMVLEEHGSDLHARNVRGMIDWSEMLEAERIFFRKFLDADDDRDKLTQDAETRPLSGGDGGDGSDSRLKLLEQRRKAEREATGNALSPRMILFREQLEEEKRGGGGGENSRVEMLEKRIAEERKAVEEGRAESDRARLLREQREIRARPPVSPVGEPGEDEMP